MKWEHPKPNLRGDNWDFTTHSRLRIVLVAQWRWRRKIVGRKGWGAIYYYTKRELYVRAFIITSSSSSSVLNSRAAKQCRKTAISVFTSSYIILSSAHLCTPVEGVCMCMYAPTLQTIPRGATTGKYMINKLSVKIYTAANDDSFAYGRVLGEEDRRFPQFCSLSFSSMTRREWTKFNLSFGSFFHYPTRGSSENNAHYRNIFLNTRVISRF